MVCARRLSAVALRVEKRLWECGLPEQRIRDPVRGNRLAYVQSLWPGSWTLGHLQSAFPSSSETKSIETTDQLYVGKLPI
jgi:hypothetical protein